MSGHLKSDISTRHLQSYSELTLQAPIRPGFVDSLDSRTYATRLKMVMDTLHALRVASREHALIRPYSDSTDRIRTINSLRMWVDEPHQRLILSVGFDRPWDAYLRIVWREVGTLLDVIFCNCDGYPISTECDFATYGQWITDARTDTRFFYNNSNLTVDDLQYLQQLERLQRDGSVSPPPPPGPGRLRAADLRRLDREASALKAQDPGAQALATANAYPAEALALGLQALSIIYRLTDVYPPGTRDGDVLLRAARELIREFHTSAVPSLIEAIAGNPALKGLTERPDLRFRQQLAWFNAPPATPTPDPCPDAPFQRGDVQGGIVHAYPERHTHGALLMFTVAQPQPAAAFLHWLHANVSVDVGNPTAPDHDGRALEAPDARLNVALSLDGLKRLGWSDVELDARFPIAFREGMEARAGLLGDERSNHPGHWTLPPLNGPALLKALGLDGAAAAVGGDGAPVRVSVCAIHLVVSLWTSTSAAPQSPDHDLITTADHPLHPAVRRVLAQAHGVRLVSVQSMRRHLVTLADDPQPTVRDHFDLIDGLSQPVPTVSLGAAAVPLSSPQAATTRRSPTVPVPADPTAPARDQVPLGELLLGHRNADNDRPAVDPLLHNGSFLVVRKLRQDVGLWRQRLSDAAQATGRSARELASKMVGRDALSGAALVARAPVGNDFDYRDDPDGLCCPIASHVRRANPRDDAAADGRLTVPRILRRGMSYGPRHDSAPESRDRGLVFMAFNASISEQFEVIQRWVAGGNSAGSYSGESDPLLGVPRRGDARGFTCHDAKGVVRIALDDPTARVPQPLVALEWGLYLFTPSVPALRQLALRAERPMRSPSLADDGEREVQRLLAQDRDAAPEVALAGWKAVLEDSSPRKSRLAQAVWTAIRERHHGALRTRYGVLVARKDLVMQVFENAAGHYSVCGYLSRMQRSFGPIYLGLDDGPDYQRQSRLANEAILAVAMEDAYRCAYRAAHAKLGALIQASIALTRPQPVPAWELTFDLKELTDHVLAEVNRAWFDLPDAQGEFIAAGGWTWDIDRPTCPGHFTAPSRYIFQPNPGATASRYGELHGAAVLGRMRAYLDAVRAGTAPRPTGAISQPLYDAAVAEGTSADRDDLLARTLIGVMMGYLPTVEAGLRSVLNEWLEDRRLWDLQTALLHERGDARLSFEATRRALLEPLKRTMLLRPLPEITWRTAASAHRLGPVDIEVGDKVVVGIVSATQQTLDDPGPADVSPVFGGDRRDAVTRPHACPGQDAGLGVMLGTLAALFEVGTLRPTPAPMTLRLRGPMPARPTSPASP